MQTQNFFKIKSGRVWDTWLVLMADLTSAKKCKMPSWTWVSSHNHYIGATTQQVNPFHSVMELFLICKTVYPTGQRSFRPRLPRRLRKDDCHRVRRLRPDTIRRHLCLSLTRSSLRKLSLPRTFTTLLSLKKRFIHQWTLTNEYNPHTIRLMFWFSKNNRHIFCKWIKTKNIGIG